MKAYSNQFPAKLKNQTVIWALWYDDKDKIITGTYALCVWKRKMMLKEGHSKKKFKIKHELTTTSK